MGLVPAVCDLHLQRMGKINRKQLHKVLCADNMLAIYHVNGIGLQRGQSDKFSRRSRMQIERSCASSQRKTVSLSKSPYESAILPLRRAIERERAP